jgi:hypothetical protein
MTYASFWQLYNRLAPGELKPQERHIIDMRRRGDKLVVIMLTHQF